MVQAREHIAMCTSIPILIYLTLPYWCFLRASLLSPTRDWAPRCPSPSPLHSPPSPRHSIESSFALFFLLLLLLRPMPIHISDYLYKVSHFALTLDIDLIGRVVGSTPQEL